jgi:hypothetical protein
MRVAAERLAINVPGWMESHATQRERARPSCTLQQLDIEDLQQAMCDTIESNGKRLPPHEDEQTFRLYREFLHAHGTPTGEYTTFSNAGSACVERKNRD